MAKLASVVILLWVLSGVAQAQCCGDCGGDGQVTINDLITAVNNALTNCGAPTPTPERTATPTRKPTATRTPNRCGFDFEDNGTNLCAFRGPFNQGCGNELLGTFSTNGSSLIVSINTNVQTTPVVRFAAQVNSSTTASLTGWTTNDFQTVHPTAGQVELAADRTQLIVFPNDPPFMILSCNFVQYIGDYVSNSAALRMDDGDQWTNLQAWQSRPLPDLSAP